MLYPNDQKLHWDLKLLVCFFVRGSIRLSLHFDDVSLCGEFGGCNVHMLVVMHLTFLPYVLCSLSDLPSLIRSRHCWRLPQILHLGQELLRSRGAGEAAELSTVDVLSCACNPVKLVALLWHVHSRISHAPR